LFAIFKMLFFSCSSEGNRTIRSFGGVGSAGATAIFNRNLANRVLLEEAVARGDVAKVQELLPLSSLGYFDRKTL
jgi:hypothetical protein